MSYEYMDENLSLKEYRMLVGLGIGIGKRERENEAKLFNTARGKK